MYIYHSLLTDCSEKGLKELTRNRDTDSLEVGHKLSQEARMASAEQLETTPSLLDDGYRLRASTRSAGSSRVDTGPYREITCIPTATSLARSE